MRGRRIWAAAAGAASIALAASWYFASPWWTLWRMREAARTGDVGTLASYADLETVNRDVAAARRANWQRNLKRIPTTTEAGRRLVATLTRSLAAADANPPIRLDDLSPWLSEIPIAPASAQRGNPYVIHKGLDAFEMRYRGASEENSPVLTFKRRGFGWRLVDARWGRQ
ncbi:MAG: hypothetical protein QOJ94_1021 [Sphingomonadales bacterium]|jgi:hypothetical protein|nr:hypothetical protein [Sphingomonadales bacterium]